MEVKINPATSPDGKLRAYVKLFLDNGFYINDVKILEIEKNGEKKLIVGFPAEKKVYDGAVKFYPIVRILDAKVREKVVKKILDEYKKIIEEKNGKK